MANLIFDDLVDGSGALIFDELTQDVTLVTKSGSDSLGTNLSEAPTVPYYQSVEDLYIALTETKTILVRVQRSDSLDVYLNEGRTLVFTGAFQKSANDALNLQVQETSSINLPFLFPLRNDSLGLSLSEAVTLVRKQFVGANDAFNLSITDAGNKTTLGATAKTASDAIGLNLSEQAQRVTFVARQSFDTFGLSLTDASILSTIQDELSWEDDNVSWGGVTLGYGRKPPIFISGRNFYQMEIGRGFDGDKIHTVLERTGLTIVGRARDGSPRNDPTSIKLIRALYPMIRGKDGEVVKISVGAQEQPDGPITWDGPYDFVIGQDSFVDPVVSGRYIAVRFEADALDEWQLLSYDLDMAIIGKN